jgi:SPOR domain
MADDNTLRSYRSNDNYRRNTSQADAPEPAFGGSDPLAELARLIGQSDPFTDNARRREPQAAAPRPQRGYDDPNDWRRHIQRPDYTEMRDEPAFDADQRYAAADERTGYEDHDPYRMTSRQQDHYDDPQPEADYRREPSYAVTNDYAEEPIYAAAPPHGGYAAGQSPHDGYAAGQPPHGEEDYDDPPRRKRGSSGLVTAVVLIGCAMLGTAGAYGYRTYTSSPSSKQAPVIIADSAPSKIVPSTEQKTARSQDRVGQSGAERLVSREEQPVALPGTSAVPRVVFPSPVQTAPTTTGSTPAPAASNAQAAGTSTDQPKRVRTVTIRPEGGDSSGQPTAGEPPARAVPPSARTAPQPAPRASRDQPLSLDPNAPAQANEPARSQQRALTPPAPRENAAPAPRVAVAPSSGGTAGYLVQVSSQRSESDAQASYRALQAKYAQLKSHQPVIRRADLGNKGIYYRAMVPFETGEEAVQFCNGLKQAGGQCIILRN